MIQYRPVSDLKDKFSEIENLINQGDSVCLTKNGKGSMVIVSLDQFNSSLQNIDQKLLEAEQLASDSKRRFSLETVINNVKKDLDSDS